jgi:hypothetical protein
VAADKPDGADEPIALYPATPLELRLVDRIPLAPLWAGVAIGLGIFCLYLAYTSAFSSAPGRLDGVGRASGMLWIAELIQDLFLGFTLAIAAAAVCGARRALAALWPHLDTTGADRDRLERAVFTYWPAPMLIVGAVSGAIGVAMLFWDPGVWETGEHVPWTHPSALWLGVRNFFNWFVVSRAMLLELMLGRAFSRLGDRLAPVDLLDRAALAPFGSRALRNVMLWMLLTAFLSLTYLGEGWTGHSLGVALAVLGSFAVAAFFTPLLGAHRRVRQLKAAELARLGAAIADARARTFAQPSTDLAGGRLADLVAYEGRIAAVREWPIDGSTWLRLALYFAIGFGSWVGAALVERVLDTALGGPGV